MEADWSVAIGADLPTIVVPWEGFIDLRRQSSLAYSLPETAAMPILAESLVCLNRETSPIFTSKCDFWTLTSDEIDPLEFGTVREEAAQGFACYIDTLAKSEILFSSFQRHESWLRAATNKIRQVKLSQAYAEFVIRTAHFYESEGFAITLYVAACGRTVDAARSKLSTALETAVTITMNQAIIAGE